MLDDLKAEVQEILVNAMKKAIADKLPILIGGLLLSLILAFIAGRLSKK